jgi:hypothetical protein
LALQELLELEANHIMEQHTAALYLIPMVALA